MSTTLQDNSQDTKQSTKSPVEEAVAKHLDTPAATASWRFILHWMKSLNDVELKEYLINPENCDQEWLCRHTRNYSRGIMTSLRLLKTECVVEYVRKIDASPIRSKVLSTSTAHQLANLSSKSDGTIPGLATAIAVGEYVDKHGVSFYEILAECCQTGEVHRRGLGLDDLLGNLKDLFENQRHWKELCKLVGKADDKELDLLAKCVAPKVER